MASLTALDASSRTGPMAEEKKPKRWISSAIDPKHKGQFRHKAEAAGESTREFAQEHKHDSGLTGKQARLAIVLIGAHHKGRHNLYKKD